MPRIKQHARKTSPKRLLTTTVGYGGTFGKKFSIGNSTYELNYHPGFGYILSVVTKHGSRGNERAKIHITKKASKLGLEKLATAFESGNFPIAYYRT